MRLNSLQSFLLWRRIPKIIFQIIASLKVRQIKYSGEYGIWELGVKKYWNLDGQVDDLPASSRIESKSIISNLIYDLFSHQSLAHWQSLPMPIPQLTCCRWVLTWFEQLLRPLRVAMFSWKTSISIVSFKYWSRRWINSKKQSMSV